jgi:hypothetical protein
MNRDNHIQQVVRIVFLKFKIPFRINPTLNMRTKNMTYEPDR